jgi:hypothetical protein
MQKSDSVAPDSHALAAEDSGPPVDRRRTLCPGAAGAGERNPEDVSRALEQFVSLLNRLAQKAHKVNQK